MSVSRSKAETKVTIRDVARLAGVSPATVSKVLNNGQYVSDAARQRVQDAVTKLDYRPNAVARSLKAKRTLTIGLITDDLEGVFTASMMRGVEEIANAQGFSVFLCNSYGSADRERADLAVLLDKQVDGLILMSGYRVRERGGPALGVGNLPMVYLYQYTRDVSVPCVLPDDYTGAKMATRHLIELGRQRIALINGPYHYEATHARLSGYRDALAEAGQPVDPLLVRVGKWYESSGYQFAHELMELPQPPDALFCCSDSIAAGTLDALLERGAKVPEDVAVVGFDNRHFAAHQQPPLTTVALPLQQMGQLAGQLLIETIMGVRPEAKLYTVASSLVIRNSCGAANSTRPAVISAR